MNHVGDDSESYALGLLDSDERERVDEHLLTCDDCIRLVGRAERTVAALVDAEASRRAMPSRRTIGAAVAAVLALAATLTLALGLQRNVESDGRLLDLLVTTHFVHVQFISPRGSPVTAKAIYERHGHWYAIIVSGTPAWRAVIIAPDGGRHPVMQPFARRGGGSVMLLDPPPAPIRSLELDDAAGNVVGVVWPNLEP